MRTWRDYTPMGARIAELAGPKGAQQKLAGVLGLSQQTVSKKLRGECPIKLQEIERLADHYKVDLDYFLDGHGSPAFEKAVSVLRAATGPDRRALAEFAAFADGENVRRALQVARVFEDSREADGGEDEEARGGRREEP